MFMYIYLQHLHRLTKWNSDENRSTTATIQSLRQPRHVSQPLQLVSLPWCRRLVSPALQLVSLPWCRRLVTWFVDHRIWSENVQLWPNMESSRFVEVYVTSRDVQGSGAVKRDANVSFSARTMLTRTRIISDPHPWQYTLLIKLSAIKNHIKSLWSWIFT